MSEQCTVRRDSDYGGCPHPATWVVVFTYDNGKSDTRNYCQWHVPNPNAGPEGYITRKRIAEVQR